LLADRLPVPVVVASNREAAVHRAAALGADCVVADDGFQRLSLPRERAFVVVDGSRGFGNGRCLPAGPLREPREALREADAVVLHGTEAVPGVISQIRMQLVPEMLVDIQGRQEPRELAWLRGQRVHGVAGIGDPERFFGTLRHLGAEVVGHPFGDHHPFRAEDLDFSPDLPLVATEKDAVKLRELGVAGWALRVGARLTPGPEAWLADLPGARGGGVS
jgi:tetraacyldisaccharide 4'-kinase